MAATLPATIEPTGLVAVSIVEDAAVEGDAPLVAAGARGMPYPGLRAFGSDEMEIFFGREAALDAMVDRLAETKFLAVLGPSGCGKSSLVKSGLYSTLTLGLLPNAGGRWRIAELNPGRQPMRNLAEALIRAGGRGKAGGDLDEAAMIELITAHLQRGPRSVVELVNGGLLGDEPGWNLLIVVDQFEELFRFGDYAGREIAEATAELLLESARSPLPIHVVITMRSEYLGACSLIPGLAEQISSGMYLTPRMTRSECRQAIEGPARIRGFDVEPELVARILNDLQCFAAFDRADGIDQSEQLALLADQLPLMQHVLNRMWRRAEAADRPSAAGRLTIRLSDYDGVGGLGGALDEHGREIVDGLEAELGNAVTPTVERLFRALVDGPSLPLAVRRPRSLGELVEAVGGEAKRAEVVKIVEAFSGPACNFLRTSEPRLDDDVLVDLGHESLIRRWSLLSGWFTAEAEAASMWRRLSQDVQLCEDGKGSLLRDLGLRRVTDWWNRERPTPYLASRYGGDFEKTVHFLKASKAAETRRERMYRRGRIAFVVAVLLIIAGLVAWKVSLAGQKNQLAQQNRELQAARALAVEHERRAEATVRSERELASLTTVTALALRDFFGSRQCSQYPEQSAAYDRCVDERVRILYEDYEAKQPQLEQLQLPGAPSAGTPTGGLVHQIEAPAPTAGERQ